MPAVAEVFVDSVDWAHRATQVHVDISGASHPPAPLHAK
jgi:hypothetical protein